MTATLPGASNSGSSSFTVMGPYDVDYNSNADVNTNNWFFVPDQPAIADGLMIFDTLVEITDRWAESGVSGTWGLTYSLIISPVDNIYYGEPIQDTDLITGGQNVMVDPVGVNLRKRTFRLDKTAWAAEQGIPITDVSLAMKIQSRNGDPLISGSVRVWLVTAQT